MSNVQSENNSTKESHKLSGLLLKSLSEILEKTTCMELVKNQNVVVIPADMDVTAACQILVRHEISSAPVYDSSSESYLGMLDFRDLVDYILIVCQNHGPDDVLIQKDPTQALEWELILQRALLGKPVSARLTTDLSRKNPFYSVMPESPLSIAINVMKSGIHRVNIMNEQSQVIGILSQTDILRFLSTKMEIMDSLSKLSLNELNIHKFPVISANEDELLHAALSKMRKNGISSIAITSHSGTLIGNISMTDIKYIFKNAKLGYLWKNCASFLRRILSEDGIERGKDRYPYFDVTLSAKVCLVIQKLLATKTHRIWVVSKERSVIGVISLADILKLLCPSSQ